MADLPILMSAPMVRALIRGDKTETRRVIKPQPEERLWPIVARFPEQQLIARWKPGDRLWVRETWRTLQKWDCLKPSYLLPDLDKICYDAAPPRNPLWVWGKTRPGTVLPRWVSRITLLVKAVRVERLQEIDEAGAIAEGIRQDAVGAGTFIGREGPDKWVAPWPTAREAYADIWDSLHGANAFDLNPWVTVTQFSVDLRNIDAGAANAQLRRPETQPPRIVAAAKAMAAFLEMDFDPESDADFVDMLLGLALAVEPLLRDAPAPDALKELLAEQPPRPPAECKGFLP